MTTTGAITTKRRPHQGRVAAAAALATGLLALTGCSTIAAAERGVSGTESSTDVGVFEVVSVDLTRVLPFEGGD